MKTIFILVIVSFIFIFASPLSGQDTVDVNLNIEHKVNGVSQFDRSKFIILHSDIVDREWETQEQQKAFFEDYDVYFGRNNGSIVWEYNNTREDPSKPGWPDLSYMESRGDIAISSYASNTFYHQFENRYSNMIVGGQEFMFPHGQETSIGGLEYEGFKATAEFYANYLTDFFGNGGTSGIPKPMLLEVINEPFVKVGNLGTTRLEMSRYHNAVAQRVKELNPTVMVGGYSAAHPMFEAAGFDHWRNNWKLFIDEAGENMDFFSFHLYDFVQETTDMSAEKFRAGSNIEAIMDMINHYSYLTLGETKPWSVSEYGWLCKTCEGSYDPKEDWYNLRSFNNMMLQLMERQDQIVNAIPFMLLKASWAKPADSEYNTYGPRLMREIGELEGEPEHGGWVYTHLLKYYQFWEGLSGTRIDTWATDIDLQTDAYVDGNTLFLILNNLEQIEHEVNIKLEDTESNQLSNLTIKNLYAVDDIPRLDTTYHSEGVEKVTLGAKATIMLKYEFEDNILINEENNETTYFADRYFQQIQSNLPQEYRFLQVNKAEYGEAVLRMGLGRDHGSSLKPSLLVNGTEVRVPSDWRGYDQKTRDRFFGVIEIPVPFDLLEENNQVIVKFGDTGGYVTSMALQVFNMTRNVTRSETDVSVQNPNSKMSVSVWPSPAKNVLNIDGLDNGLHSATVYNINGVRVAESSVILQSGQIDVSMLPKGIYFLNFESGCCDALKFVKD